MPSSKTLNELLFDGSASCWCFSPCTESTLTQKQLGSTHNNGPLTSWPTGMGAEKSAVACPMMGTTSCPLTVASLPGCIFTLPHNGECGHVQSHSGAWFQLWLVQLGTKVLQIRLSGEPLVYIWNPVCLSLTHTDTYLSTTSNHITRTIGGLDYDCK